MELWTGAAHPPAGFPRSPVATPTAAGPGPAGS
jgi:hypothetical protein